jgi:hypothetical protein
MRKAMTRASKSRGAGVGRCLIVFAAALPAWTLAGFQPAAASPACASASLSSVAATSASNAWAVGSCGDTGQNLIEHWDGKAWSVQPTASQGAQSALSGVVATSAISAWAVGKYTLSNGTTTRTLIEHWDGSDWKAQPSPNPYRFSGEPLAELDAVGATSSSNAWAVGEVGGPYALIEHWNGKAWTAQRSPRNVGNLDGVAATSPSNAWVVGSSYFLGGGAIIAHWNGRGWKVQAALKKVSNLSAATAPSARQAWAAGPGIPAQTQAQIVHWNGRAWKLQSIPHQSIQLSGVSSTSASNAWAVGRYFAFRFPSGPVLRPVIEHWNGRTWALQSTPSSTTGWLVSVAGTSPTNAFAVGVNAAGGALIEHWDGHSWSLQRAA